MFYIIYCYFYNKTDIIWKLLRLLYQKKYIYCFLLWFKIIEHATYSNCFIIPGVLYWPIRILYRNSPFCNWKCNPLNCWLLYCIHFCLKWFITVWNSLTPAVIYHEDKHPSFSVLKAFTNHFQLSITQVSRIHTQPLNAQPGPQLFTQIHWPCEKKPPVYQSL